MLFVVLTVREEDEGCLLRKAEQGDSRSLDVLLSLHRDALANWLKRQFDSLSWDEVEDAVQVCFIQVSDGVQTGKVRQAFRSYVFAVGRNRCLDIIRSRKPNTSLDDPDVPEIASSHSEADQITTAIALQNAIMSLPAEERLLLNYALVDGLTCTQIAKMRRTSIATVSRGLKSAKGKLYRMLQPEI